MGVVVHGEVGEPGAGVGVHHHLVPPHAVNHDGLTRHRVLVIVLGRDCDDFSVYFHVSYFVILVKDGGNLLAVLPDAEQGLLVVVGGDVELEEVDAPGGTGEDAGVDVEAAPDIAVSAVEGQVLLTTAVIGLVSE